MRMVIPKLLVLYEITGNNGFIELVKDILLQDKPCWEREDCLCNVCWHCDRCKK